MTLSFLDHGEGTKRETQPTCRLVTPEGLRNSERVGVQGPDLRHEG